MKTATFEEIEYRIKQDLISAYRDMKNCAVKIIGSNNPGERKEAEIQYHYFRGQVQALEYLARQFSMRIDYEQIAKG
jgi:hypothetical protein